MENNDALDRAREEILQAVSSLQQTRGAARDEQATSLGALEKQIVACKEGLTALLEKGLGRADEEHLAEIRVTNAMQAGLAAFQAALTEARSSAQAEHERVLSLEQTCQSLQVKSDRDAARLQESEKLRAETNDHLAALQKSVDQLTFERNDLANQLREGLDSLTESMLQLAQANEQLTEATRACEAAQAQAKSSARAEQGAVAELAKVRAEHDAASSALRSQASLQAQTLEAAQREARESADKLQQALEQLRVTTQECAEGKARSLELEQRHRRELESLVDSHREQLDRIEEEKSAQLSNADLSRRGLKEELDRLSHTLEEASRSSLSFLNERDNARQELAKVIAAQKDAEAQLKQVVAERDRLMRDANERIASLGFESTRLQSAVDDLVADRDAARSEVEEKAAQCASLEEKLALLSQQTEKTQAALEAKLAQLTQQLQKTQAQLEAKVTQAAQQTEQSQTDAAQKLQELNKQLERAQADILRIATERDVARDETEQLADQLADQCARWKQTNTEAQAKYSAELEALRRELQFAQQERSQAQEELARLREQAETAADVVLAELEVRPTPPSPRTPRPVSPSEAVTAPPPSKRRKSSRSQKPPTTPELPLEGESPGVYRMTAVDIRDEVAGRDLGRTDPSRGKRKKR